MMPMSTLKTCPSRYHTICPDIPLSRLLFFFSEHFGNHEKIELAEENKERKFQGLSELTAEEMHKIHEEEDAAFEARQKAAAEEEAEAAKATNSAKFQRPAKPDARELLKGAVREANQKSEWGTGEDGYKRPKTPADKLRYFLVFDIHSQSSAHRLLSFPPGKMCHTR